MALGLGLVVTAAAGTAHAVEADEADGPAYPVSQLELAYAAPGADLPKTVDLLNLEVALTPTASGYIAPPAEGEAPTRTLRLAEIGTTEVKRLHGSALQAIAQRVVDDLNTRGLIGIYVRPHPDQLDAAGRDLREGQGALTLMIHAARVDRVRTIAMGERRIDGSGVNAYPHRHIAHQSPLAAGDLLSQRQLDRYVFFLNRHPGRRVDVALAPAADTGRAVVDYMVIENKPWLVYAQIANTGTEATGEWQQRFGFIHNQLTHNDDILSLAYTRSGLEDTQSLVGSYQTPTPIGPRVRFRAHGGWSTFEAEQIGIFDTDFDGEQWWFGADGIWNFHQHRDWFFDLVGGVRYQSIQVNNQTIGVAGDEDFVLPHLGVEVERSSDIATTSGLVDVMFNLADVAGTGGAEIDQLGRTNTQEQFAIVQWRFDHAMYLEPVLNRRAWEDVSTPASSTLAHEAVLSFRGQSSLGDRVPPQFEGVVGGLYTVRGYDESAVAGDTTLVFTAEYRFHLPRALRIDPEPSQTMILGKPFRVAPQQVYGRPDWDLVLKAFVDVGHVVVADPIIEEADQTLAGAGVGVELAFRRNVRIRTDVGWALEDAGPNEAGDTRVHFTATLLY